MRVIDATDDHLEAVLEMAAAFCAIAGERFDRVHTLANIAGIRAGGFLLVAQDDDRAVGMLAAVAAPGLCSPDPVLHEVCMWVAPDGRGTAAMLLLMREFDRRAAAQGISSQLSTLPTSPEALSAIYCRMGYEPVGSSYIKRRST